MSEVVFFAAECAAPVQETNPVLNEEDSVLRINKLLSEDLPPECVRWMLHVVQEGDTNFPDNIPDDYAELLSSWPAMLGQLSEELEIRYERILRDRLHRMDRAGIH